MTKFGAGYGILWAGTETRSPIKACPRPDRGPGTRPYDYGWGQALAYIEISSWSRERDLLCFLSCYILQTQTKDRGNVNILDDFNEHK